MGKNKIICDHCGEEVGTAKAKEARTVIVDSCVKYDGQKWTDTAWQGCAYLRYDDWNNGNVYYEKLISPTWRKVFNAANRLVKQTTDRHHIYFEGIHLTKDTKYKLPVYDIFMGS